MELTCRVFRHIGTKASTQACNRGIFLMSGRCWCLLPFPKPCSLIPATWFTGTCRGCGITEWPQIKPTAQIAPGSTLLCELSAVLNCSGSAPTSSHPNGCCNFASFPGMCCTYSWMSSAVPSHWLNLGGGKGEGPQGSGCVSRGRLINYTCTVGNTSQKSTEVLGFFWYVLLLTADSITPRQPYSWKLNSLRAVNKLKQREKAQSQTPALCFIREVLWLKNDSSPADVRSSTGAIAMCISFLLHVIFRGFLSESSAELAASPGAWRQHGSITIDTRDANYFPLGMRKLFAAKRAICRFRLF